MSEFNKKEYEHMQNICNEMEKSAEKYIEENITEMMDPMTLFGCVASTMAINFCITYDVDIKDFLKIVELGYNKMKELRK